MFFENDALKRQKEQFEKELAEVRENLGKQIQDLIIVQKEREEEMDRKHTRAVDEISFKNKQLLDKQEFNYGNQIEKLKTQVEELENKLKETSELAVKEREVAIKEETADLKLKNGVLESENAILKTGFANMGFDVKDMKGILNKLVEGIISKNEINVIR